jgi:hypothetical protein
MIPMVLILETKELTVDTVMIIMVMVIRIATGLHNGRTVMFRVPTGIIAARLTPNLSMQI